jgi:hypothetical protein
MMSIQINQPSRYNNFSSLLLDAYLQLNVFRVSSRPSSGAQQLLNAPKVKPEAATAFVELLMMGVRTPETR